MDPQITWHSLLIAWARGNWLEVTEHAESLLEWLGKGGFPPNTVAAPELGVDCHGIVAKLAAKLAIAHARSVLENPDGVPAIVPFALACAHCNSEGPPTYMAAQSDGWVGIQYVPVQASENFLGICPNCQAEDDQT